jgi:hypothetical protein
MRYNRLLCDHGQFMEDAAMLGLLCAKVSFSQNFGKTFDHAAFGLAGEALGQLL